MQMGDSNNRPDKSAETQSPELWGSAEIREALGWSTRRHLQLARETQSFPRPVATINAGRTEVWLAADVRAWAAEHLDPKRRPKWRREEAVRLYRRGKGVTITSIARQLQAKDDSVRRWLRDAGEKLPSEKRRDASA